MIRMYPSGFHTSTINECACTSRTVSICYNQTMVTTRPAVHFREPKDSSFSSMLDQMESGETLPFSLLRCEECPHVNTNLWSGPVLVAAGIVFSGLVVVLVARRCLYKQSLE